MAVMRYSPFLCISFESTSNEIFCVGKVASIEMQRADLRFVRCNSDSNRIKNKGDYFGGYRTLNIYDQTRV